MTRVISGAALAAAALAAILFLPTLGLRVLCVMIAAAAAHEYIRVAGAARGPSQWLLIAAVGGMCGAVSSGEPLQGVAMLIIALMWVAVEVLFLGRTIHQAGVSVVAPIYIGLPMGMLVAIHEAAGWQATILLIATVVVSDSGQYYSGRAFGRRPLAPTISPKKTVEGAIGGVVLGTAFMAVASAYVFPGSNRAAAALLGAVIVFLGICGDLFESRLKRTAGIKDSSSLIPGHGGVLDRIDALLFATPAFYLYLQTLG
jgi:phosphatidate cytidylyltransferase